jgi:hypothetical protein
MSYIVTDLIIYPVKSLGGIHLSSSKVELEGLQFDRRWMLVDEQNKMITQRQFHELCLFQIQFCATGFLITHRIHQTTFIIPFDVFSDEEISVSIWDDKVKANVVSVEANTWFSMMLNLECKLVRLTENSQRKIDLKYAFENETTSFSDAFPILIIGENSLSDLNAKLKNKVPMNRFRPNIVFSGGGAFDEDHFSKILIHDTQLRVAKPCARCVVTTINQETAIAEHEPLKTLSSYRNIGNKVLFGQNFLVTKVGEIRLGDQLILED